MGPLPPQVLAIQWPDSLTDAGVYEVSYATGVGVKMALSYLAANYAACGEIQIND